MANNQPNVGKDATISIVGPTGALLAMGLLEDFTANVRSTPVQSLPINNNGIPVNRITYQGWEGTFRFARQNGNLDLLHNLLESNFYAGNCDIQFQIAEVIRNCDGSVDRLTYLDCHMYMDEHGSFTQNAKVNQSLRFVAAQRVGG